MVYGNTIRKSDRSWILINKKKSWPGIDRGSPAWQATLLVTELFRLTNGTVLNGHKSASLVTVCFLLKLFPFFPQWPLAVYLLSAYYRIYTADSNTRGTQEFRFIKE